MSVHRECEISSGTRRDEDDRERRTFNWRCGCGTEGPGRFPSRRAAEDDHDDHMLAVIDNSESEWPT